MGRMEQNADVVIDQTEMCECVAKRLGIDLGLVSAVLDIELDFLEKEGLLLEGGPLALNNQDNVSVGEINFNALSDYVASQTGLQLYLVKQILNSEMVYLHEREVAV